jgi:predicted NACHT family NTPase
LCPNSLGYCYSILHIPGTIYQYQGDTSAATLSKTANIAQILLDSSISEKILLRGVPGSGKTTLLLQLAKELLNRAMNNSGGTIANFTGYFLLGK